MPANPPARRRLEYPGDYITSAMTYCGTCGAFDHNDGDDQVPGPPTKRKSLITIHTSEPAAHSPRIRTGVRTGVPIEVRQPRSELREIERIDHRMFPTHVNWDNERVACRRHCHPPQGWKRPLAAFELRDQHNSGSARNQHLARPQEELLPWLQP